MALAQIVNIGHDSLQMEAHLQVLTSAASQSFTEVGQNTWQLTIEEDKWHNVIGFGSASIPSYDFLVRTIPDRKLKFSCITWNINEKPARLLEVLAEFIVYKDSNTLEDVISIALQELPPQRRLYHEEALNLIALAMSDTHEIYFSLRCWSQMILIFIRKEHLRYAITTPSSKFVPSARLAKPVRTKGSIGVCFRIYQRMVIIVASHFSHGSPRDRLNDYQKMLKCLRFETLQMWTGKDYTIFGSEIVLWMGDLNFRIDKRANIPPHADKKDVIDATELMEFDELTQNRERGIVFAGFKEATITFPPTYKFHLKTKSYDKTRKPSYTDRVLYWARNLDQIEVIKYDSINDTTESDHRPVHCSFAINVVNKPIPVEYHERAKQEQTQNTQRRQRC